MVGTGIKSLSECFGAGRLELLERLERLEQASLLERLKRLEQAPLSETAGTIGTGFSQVCSKR